MEERLILIDIGNKKALFYNVALKKITNKYQVIVFSGKIGNKGKCMVVYESDTFEEAKKEFWNKVYEKKKEHYMLLKDIDSDLKNLFGFSKCTCSLCGYEIEPKLYKKIEAFLSSEENIDVDSPYFNKVLCFDCQKENNIYKGKNKRC